MQSCPSQHREGVMLASSKCILPKLLPKCNTTLPHKSSPIYREQFSPFKMQNPYKSFPTNSFIKVSLFFMLFLFTYMYVFFFFVFLFPSIFFFPFSPQNWNSSPKRKNYSPAFEANNRRTDNPGDQCALHYNIYVK